jgi:hypothetical protein
MSKSLQLDNKKFGALTVTKRGSYDNRGRFNWICQCDCGNIKEVAGRHLISGRTKSCGCFYTSRGNKSIKWKGHGDLSSSYFSDVKNKAKARNLLFTITIEDAWNLFLQQNKKCALTGLDIHLRDETKLKTASLDRIDSSKGYTIDNIQWVHKDVNLIKMDFDQDYFIYICQLVCHKHENKTEN